MQELETKDKGNDDTISALAIDYGMHQTNKKRIQNLMALLSGKGELVDIEIDNIDIKLGDSMSNADVVS